MVSNRGQVYIEKIYTGSAMCSLTLSKGYETMYFCLRRVKENGTCVLTQPEDADGIKEYAARERVSPKRSTAQEPRYDALDDDPAIFIPHLSPRLPAITRSTPLSPLKRTRMHDFGNVVRSGEEKRFFHPRRSLGLCITLTFAHGTCCSHRRVTEGCSALTNSREGCHLSVCVCV